MKKRYISYLTGLVILSLCFEGCSPHYGSHFNTSTNFYNKANSRVEALKSIEKDLEVVESNPHTSYNKKTIIMKDAPIAEELLVSSEEGKAIVKLPSVEKLVAKHRKNVGSIRSSGHDVREMRLELKKEQKRSKKEIKKQLKKDIKELRKTHDDEYVLMMVLAVFIPPLSVGLVYGITTEFWLSLLLTLLFFLPGMIYSLIKVHQYYKG